MEIVDKPLSEIIKEQKIGASLRKPRNTKNSGGASNANAGGRGRGNGPNAGGRARRGASRGTGNSANGRGSAQGGNRQTERLRFRAGAAGKTGPKSSFGGRRNSFVDAGSSRGGANSDDRRRSVKAVIATRQRPRGFDRNEQSRRSGRSDAIARARASERSGASLHASDAGSSLSRRFSRK